MSRAGSLGLVAATTLFCCSEFEGEAGGLAGDGGGGDASTSVPEGGAPDGSTDPVEVPPYRTRLLADLTTRRAGSAATPLLVGPDYTLLLGNDAGGRRVWVTRGTPATTMVLPITVDARFDNYYVAAADGAGAYVYLHRVPTPTRGWSVSVWHTDGTAAGTRLVREVDFEAGRWAATLPWVNGAAPGLFAVGSRFCVVSTPAGSTATQAGRLHCIDATTGSEQRYEAVSFAFEHQGKLVLGQQPPMAAGPVISVTDGASEPTVLVTDTTLVAGVSTPTGAVLQIRRTGRGDQLVSYGTVAGMSVWDTPNALPMVERLHAAGGRAFATLYTSDEEPRLPRLAVTDGSAAGTRFFDDPLPGTPFVVTDVLPHGAEVAYWALISATQERKLFVSSGLGAIAPPTVRPIAELAASPSGFFAGTSLGSSFVFGLGLPGAGTELWSAQTATGATALVRDLFEGHSGLVGSIVPAGSAAAFTCQTPTTGPELCLTTGRPETTTLSPLDPASTFTAGTSAAAASTESTTLLASDRSPWKSAELVLVDLANGVERRFDAGRLLDAELRGAQVRSLPGGGYIVHYASMSQGDRAFPSPPLLVARPAGEGLDVTTGPGASALGPSTQNGVLVDLGGAWSYWAGGDAPPARLETETREVPSGTPTFYRIGAHLLAAYAGTLRGSTFLSRVDDARLVPLAIYSAVAQAEISSVSDVGGALLLGTDRGNFLTRGIPDDFVEVVIPDVPSELVGGTAVPLRSGRLFHFTGTELYRSIQRSSITVNDVLPYEGLYAIRDGVYVPLCMGRTRWTHMVGDTLVVAQQIDSDRRVRVSAVSAAGAVETLADGIEFNTGANQLFEAGGRLYFTHDDGLHGRELWVTNGTKAGTMLTADIAPGLASAFGGASNDPSRIVGARGEGVLVLADDFVHGTEPHLLEPAR